MFSQQDCPKDLASFFGGTDDFEEEQQKKKPCRPAHPNFSELQDRNNKHRNAKKERKTEAKNRNLNICKTVKEQSPQQIQTQQSINEQKHPPRFLTLIKGQEEEIQQNLEEFVEQQYKDSEHKRLTTPFKKESDFGNTEYKLRLVNPNMSRMTHLTTQMNFRLQEGHGLAYYKIGVEDSGNPLGLGREDMLESLRTLCTMASSLKAEVLVAQISQGQQGKVAEMVVRKGQKEGINLDVRVLLLGETGSGKTSLLGVLTSGLEDDGKGLARMKVQKNHKEILYGKTERISHTVIGLDSEGRIINHQAQLSFLQDSMIEKVVELSSKLITFIDMGGHKRAHNQMIRILNTQFPDYALLVISATAEVSTFTEDYVKLLFIHQFPMMVILTHIDVATEDQVDKVVQHIKRIVTKLNDESVPMIVRSDQDVVQFSKQILNRLIVPIFPLSNTVVNSLNHFLKFLNLLPSNNELTNNANMPAEFAVFSTFEKKQSNILGVLGGTVLKGVIKEKQVLMLGPDRKGSFYPVEIQEVQCNRVRVKSAQCGQTCSVSVKALFPSTADGVGNENNPVRRGMVLVESRTNPRAYWEFQAELWLFDENSTTRQISYAFQPVIYTQTARQICKIIKELQENDVPNQPQLIKKKSKSIDQKSNKVVRSMSNLDQTQQQDIFRKKSHELSESPIYRRQLRKKSFSDLEYDKDKDIIKQNTPQLFVICEKQVKGDMMLLEAGKKNNIRMRFMYQPEYIQKGMRFVVNENQFRAVGWIKQLYY